jgi:hypothetical protein
LLNSHYADYASRLAPPLTDAARLAITAIDTYAIVLHILPPFSIFTLLQITVEYSCCHATVIDSFFFD